MQRTRRTTVALVAAAALIIPAAPAGAATVSDPIIEGLITPLGLAVGSDGTIYVAQSFAGLLTAFDKKGNGRTIAQVSPEDGAITGVAADGRGTVSYTVTGAPPQGAYRVLPNGNRTFLGDTSSLEFNDNPDGEVLYGFTNVPAGCDVPAPIGGDVNPNAYAVAILPDGTRVVADAGGNTLVKVAPGRSVGTLLAVLPPVELPVDEALAAQLQVEPCAIGSTYTVHPVPTDVEVGPDGMLYVSSLPGEPGGAPVPGSGGVFRVNPNTGSVTPIATGFFGAVDLAIAPDGTIYVAELFGGQISKVVNGGPADDPVAVVDAPGALEWHKGRLYATVNVFGPGAVVTITP